LFWWPLLSTLNTGIDRLN